MEHPAASSRDDDAHRPTDREELTLSPQPSETAAAASQNRTLRTDRLYQKDPARQTRRRAPENLAENATLLSYPKRSAGSPAVRVRYCNIRSSTVQRGPSMPGMLTAQPVNQTASDAEAADRLGTDLAHWLHEGPKPLGNGRT
jgi:hypothetical protein